MNAQEAVSAILALPLPSKVSFHAAKIARLMAADVQSFERHRNELVVRLGVQSEKDETQYAVAKERIPEFTAELNDLAATIVTLDIEPLTLAMFDGRDVKGETLLALGPLFVEG